MDIGRLQKLNRRINKVDNKFHGEQTHEKQNIVDEFVDYVYDYLKIEEPCTEINVDFDGGDFVEKNRSFGGYSPSEKNIYIVGANRNLADVLRTLAHEIVHHKQNVDGRLNDKSGETGSEHENEANAIAGVLLRNYGKINKEIYLL
jgi:hypothetical protein